MVKHIYAGIFRRFAAMLIDFLFFCIIFFPITRLIKGVWIMGASDHLWSRGLFITDPLCVSFLLFMAAYFILMEAYCSKTIGKMAAGIEVRGVDGKKPGLKKSLIRNLLRIADGLPALNILGIVLIISTQQNTRLGDIVAHTRVIRIEKQKSFS